MLFLREDMAHKFIARHRDRINRVIEHPALAERTDSALLRGLRSLQGAPFDKIQPYLDALATQPTERGVKGLAELARREKEEPAPYIDALVDIPIGERGMDGLVVKELASLSLSKTKAAPLALEALKEIGRAGAVGPRLAIKKAGSIVGMALSGTALALSSSLSILYLSTGYISHLLPAALSGGLAYGMYRLARRAHSSLRSLIELGRSLPSPLEDREKRNAFEEALRQIKGGQPKQDEEIDKIAGRVFSEPINLGEVLKDK